MEHIHSRRRIIAYSCCNLCKEAYKLARIPYRMSKKGDLNWINLILVKAEVGWKVSEIWEFGYLRTAAEKWKLNLVCRIYTGKYIMLLYFGHPNVQKTEKGTINNVYLWIMMDKFWSIQQNSKFLTNSWDFQIRVKYHFLYRKKSTSTGRKP